ncbi:MAG: NAD(P)-dependent oxidoreductase [Verrucomicrobiaceae bacterium]|nr:MAG: NAD(P)-dependent oxidoreductase [Verrucomicrobiaceae bacterium]
MRVAVTGTTGRVGAALASHFASRHEVIALPRNICDLADPCSLASALERLECDVFLNPAGLTSLEMCEDDPALAMRVNATAAGEIAAWAAERGVPVFHFSTDYVFSGNGQGLRHEEDPTGAVSVYGSSKLAGEEAVLAFPGNCVIRVAWVFGPEKFSFIDRVFDDALAGLPLAAVSDKFSLPVLTTDLAAWTEKIVESKTTGIVQACQSGEPISWHDMALCALDEMVACGLLPEAPPVRKLTLSEMTSFRATRPRHTAMDTTRLTRILGHVPRPWQEAVKGYIRSRASALRGEQDPGAHGKVV